MVTSQTLLSEAKTTGISACAKPANPGALLPQSEDDFWPLLPPKAPWAESPSALSSEQKQRVQSCPTRTVQGSGGRVNPACGVDVTVENPSELAKKAHAITVMRLVPGNETMAVAGWRLRMVPWARRENAFLGLTPAAA